MLQLFGTPIIIMPPYSWRRYSAGQLDGPLIISDRYSSVTAMLQQLATYLGQVSNLIIKYPDYSYMYKHCLKSFIMTIHYQFHLTFYQWWDPLGNSYHPRHYILPNSNTVLYQQIFYSRTIHDWNNLPDSLVITLTNLLSTIYFYQLLCRTSESSYRSLGKFHR